MIYIVNIFDLRLIINSEWDVRILRHDSEIYISGSWIIWQINNKCIKWLLVKYKEVVKDKKVRKMWWGVEMDSQRYLSSTTILNNQIATFHDLIFWLLKRQIL